MDDQVRAGLHARLRRPPSPHSVPGSLPILFFGDLASARIATVGLNPSDQEYTDGNGELLTRSRQRFATLASLGAADRASLDSAQCDEAIHGYPPDKQEKATRTVLEQAELLSANWGVEPPTEPDAMAVMEPIYVQPEDRLAELPAVAESREQLRTDKKP